MNQKILQRITALHSQRVPEAFHVSVMKRRRQNTVWTKHSVPTSICSAARLLAHTAAQPRLTYEFPTPIPLSRTCRQSLLPSCTPPTLPLSLA